LAGIPISGYADGTFLALARDEDAFKKHIGSSGEGARSKSNNRGGSATFTLMQSSPCNDLLSALHAADDLSGAGVGPFIVKDGSGRSLYAAENAWIRKAPDGEFARELSNREWVIDMDDMKLFTGGNTESVNV
jgi:hypothetical protein